MKLSILAEWVSSTLNKVSDISGCMKLAKAKGATEYQEYAAVTRALLLYFHSVQDVNPETKEQYDSFQTYGSGFYKAFYGKFPEFLGEYGGIERTRFHDLLKDLKEAGVLHQLMKPVTAKKGKYKGVKKLKPFLQLPEYKKESSWEGGSGSRAAKALEAIG